VENETATSFLVQSKRLLAATVDIWVFVCFYYEEIMLRGQMWIMETGGNPSLVFLRRLV
jgi:hypothetical protein